MHNRYTTKSGSVYEVDHKTRLARCTKSDRYSEHFLLLGRWYRADYIANQRGRLVFLWPDGEETSTSLIVDTQAIDAAPVPDSEVMPVDEEELELEP